MWLLLWHCPPTCLNSGLLSSIDRGLEAGWGGCHGAGVLLSRRCSGGGSSSSRRLNETQWLRVAVQLEEAESEVAVQVGRDHKVVLEGEQAVPVNNSATIKLR